MVVLGCRFFGRCLFIVFYRILSVKKIRHKIRHAIRQAKTSIETKIRPPQKFGTLPEIRRSPKISPPHLLTRNARPPLNNSFPLSNATYMITTSIETGSPSQKSAPQNHPPFPSKIRPRLKKIGPSPKIRHPPKNSAPPRKFGTPPKIRHRPKNPAPPKNSAPPNKVNGRLIPRLTNTIDFWVLQSSVGL